MIFSAHATLAPNIAEAGRPAKQTGRYILSDRQMARKQ